MGWKLFAGFNVLLGAVAIASLVGGYGEITLWRLVSDAMSVLGTVILVLYAFGGTVFSPELRKAIAVVFLAYALAEAAYLLWDVYKAHTSPTEIYTPISAWVVLVFASAMSYFTLIAIWRYSQGHTLREQRV